MERALGKKLGKARIKKGLTQKDLATILDVSSATISNWENGGNIDELHTKKVQKFIKSAEPRRKVNREKEQEIIAESEPSIFSRWLQETRIKAGLSVPQLAATAKISAVAIYNIESGKIANPQQNTRNALAQALNAAVPAQDVVEVEQKYSINGLGNLTDFDPHNKSDWPKCAGVYVLYDISQRPIYIGKGKKISVRLKDHNDKFWYKQPVVQYGSFIKVEDQTLCNQLEQTMIKFLKSNAVINKQLTEEFSADRDDEDNNDSE